MRHLFSVFPLLLVAACGGSGASGPTVPAVTPPEVEQESFSLANGARSAAGVNLLDLQVVVAGAARDHSAAMRDFDFVGHSGPDGTLVERLAAAGVEFKSAAENLGRTSGVMDPASWTHEQLMASSEHRQHILDPKYIVAGVGVVQEGDTFWLTQIFVELD